MIVAEMINILTRCNPSGEIVIAPHGNPGDTVTIQDVISDSSGVIILTEIEED